MKQVNHLLKLKEPAGNDTIHFYHGTNHESYGQRHESWSEFLHQSGRLYAEYDAMRRL